jgi:glycosyltransferase involved in cell wall biosynthesis
MLQIKNELRPIADQAKKVSVIIPTYNRETYISQAIESVIDQTYKDIEIIVVDDGSTDGTFQKIQPYEDSIHYIYTENGGPSHARNVGLKNATGDYIAFLDSDDLYYPDKIELQVEFLERFQEIAMVCTEFSGFDDEGYWDECHLKKYHGPAYKNMSYGEIYSESYTLDSLGMESTRWRGKKAYIGNVFDTYLNNIIISTNTIMFRKGVLDSVGLFDKRFHLLEEYHFVLKICKHYKIAFLDVPTFKLRYHSDQISEANRESIEVVITKQSNMVKIVEELGLNDDLYYSKHSDQVHKRLAVLNKSLAIPLMGKGNDPLAARLRLKSAAKYGHPEPLLWALTFLPYLPRRVAIRLIRLLKII